jgi:hypothetical protein
MNPGYILTLRLIEIHLYRGINEFKKGYQPRNNLLKDTNGDLLADTLRILNRWENYYCQILNMYWVNSVRRTEIHTAEPLIPEPSSIEVKIAIENLERYTLPGTDQIPAELIQTGGTK